MSTLVLSHPKGNALAIERMKEKDEQEVLEKMNTKQRPGTPAVRKISNKDNSTN